MTNLLFLFSDQHARHVTGAYGDPIVETPALDRLAADGVTFDNAYTTAPLCTPARMAMLTAQYSYRIGCWTNSDVLASDIPTHAHSLGAAGYRPTLIGRLHSIGPDQLHGYADRLVGDHSTNWPGGHAHSLGVLERTNEPFRISIERAGRASPPMRPRTATCWPRPSPISSASARRALCRDRRPDAAAPALCLLDRGLCAL